MRISGIIRGPRRVRRVAHIARKLASHGLGFLVGKLNIRRYLPAKMRIPAKGGLSEPSELPARLATVLEELGPTFVKFGQMLSTRPDVLPEEYIEELQRITHHVHPFPGRTARGIVEEELEAPVGELFDEFNDEPRASGSIAQVHEARLHDGTEVVVKVLRPGIQDTIEDDLAIMQFLARRMEQVEDVKNLRPRMLVDEFARLIRGELNLLNEAANTHRLGKELDDEERVVIPTVYWDQTTRRVLTLQKLDGELLAQADLKKMPAERKRAIAATLMESFLDQIFRLGLFHADPHAGNLVLLGGGRIGLIDMGQIGRITESMRGHISMGVVALSNAQMELAAEIVGEIGSLPVGSSSEDFRAEIAGLLDRYSGTPVSRLDLGRAFRDAMAVVRRYGVVMPRDFVLLGKTLGTVSGVVMDLAPDLKVERLARQYAGSIVKQRLRPSSLKKTLTRYIYHISNLLRDGPAELREIFRKVHRGQLEFTIRHEGFDKAVAELDRTGNRLSLSIILAAIIMASSSLLTAKAGPTVNLFGWQASILGFVGLMFGMVLGAWLIFGIFRSGRL